MASLVHQRAATSAPENGQGQYREAHICNWRAITSEFDYWATVTGHAKEWEQLATEDPQNQDYASILAAIGVLAAHTRETPNERILQTAYRMASFATQLIDLGDTTGAEKLTNSLILFDLGQYSSDFVRFAAATAQLGECCRRLEKYTASERLLQPSLRAVQQAQQAESSNGSASSGTQLAGQDARSPYLELLIRLYEDWGKPIEARKYRQMLRLGIISKESPSL